MDNSMRKLSFVLAIFSVLLVTLTSVAQNYVAQGDQPFPKLKSVKPYVDFSLIGATGSRNGASVGMGTQVWAKRFLFDVNTHMDSMDKVTDAKQQTGTTVRALGSAEFHFKKLFLLGGGYDWGKTCTDEWSKQ